MSTTIPAERTMEAGLRAEGAAIPLLGVEVKAEVVAGHARARVRQRYRHDGPRPVEAVYTFPLPSRAALSGFSMTVAGRRLDGEVKEREEAFRRYDEAIADGHGAALLEQERANVFTANVGNLLPGEETVLEIEYIEPLTADEGAVRFCLPTVVAPRYMPGTASGDRSGHGWADPTSRVPDADRISPPVGDARDVAYGLSIELVVDLGQDVEVESPSHAIRTTQDGTRSIVRFAQREVSLDRDVVVSAYPRKAVSDAAPLATVVAHRAGTGPGTFALTLVPDLAGSLARREVRSRVVFVIDRSGSMGGASMDQARTALRLCLRQLREGDTFGIIAFDDQIETFETKMVPFTQATLRRADEWIARVDARGGTKLLEPLERAVALAPDGIVVLLTDGQVGNEDEIARTILETSARPRVYAFGIGTNVSDALLRDLAEQTGGALESIHPGERIDEKVIAQFSRATALRVTDLEVRFDGLEVGQIAPAQPVALVDGEPFTVFGTYEQPGHGKIVVRGKLGAERFALDVPVELPASADRPAITKLWARARIADLERAALSGRRAESNKDRIIRLSTEHGVVSRYTSFVVVEKRTGDRLARGVPETVVVPVAPPAGWTMAMPKKMKMADLSRAMPAPRLVTRGGAPPPPPPPRAAMPPGAAPRSAPPPLASMSASRMGRVPEPMEAEEECRTMAIGSVDRLSSFEGEAAGPKGGGLEAADHGDPIVALLSRQQASGLWEDPGKTVLESTVRALLALVRLDVTSTHPVFGAQVKKAADALLALVAASPGAEPRLVELALGVAWLSSSGRRSRKAIEEAIARLPLLSALRAALAKDEDVRAHVERLA